MACNVIKKTALPGQSFSTCELDHWAYLSFVVRYQFSESLAETDAPRHGRSANLVLHSARFSHDAVAVPSEFFAF